MGHPCGIAISAVTDPGRVAITRFASGKYLSLYLVTTQHRAYSSEKETITFYGMRGPPDCISSTENGVAWKISKLVK
jgi:hypothetical protein